MSEFEEKTEEFTPNEPVSESLDRVVEAFKTQRIDFIPAGVVGILLGEVPNKEEGHIYIVSRTTKTIAREELLFARDVFSKWIEQCFPETA